MSKPIPRHQPNTDSESDKPTLSPSSYLHARSGAAQPMHRALRVVIVGKAAPAI